MTNSIKITQIKTKQQPIHVFTRAERRKQLGIYGNLYFESRTELIAIIREQDRLIAKLKD